MRTLSFFAIVIAAGCIAGTVHGLLNVAFVEPYLDIAIGVENQRMFDAGEAQNTPQFQQQFTDYRVWQKQGSIVGGAMLGTAEGALFGLVFAYSRNALPGNSDIKKALVLAGIMWAVLYLIPFLKYPANPPTVGLPSTIFFRATSYLFIVAYSGLGALGFYKLSKRLKNKRKLLALVGYAGYIAIAYVVMEPVTDPIRVTMDVLNGFRAISATTMTITWIVNGLILGYLWQRFKPHLEKEQVQK